MHRVEAAEIQNVVAARNHNSQAWNDLFQRYQLPLFSLVFELLKREQDALDIVQETFIAATRHIHSLRENRKFGSWLFGIAHQKCVLLWRKPFSESCDLEENDLVAPDPSPDESMIHHEDREQFFQAIDSLSEALRSVILLHFLEDFSIDEIAGILELPSGTVKSRLFHAKRQLKNVLQRKVNR